MARKAGREEGRAAGEEEAAAASTGAAATAPVLASAEQQESIADVGLATETWLMARRGRFTT